MKPELQKIVNAVRDRLKGYHGTGGGKTWHTGPTAPNGTTGQKQKNQEQKKDK